MVLIRVSGTGLVPETTTSADAREKVHKPGECTRFVAQIQPGFYRT
jgi:hypothetical protein